MVDSENMRFQTDVEIEPVRDENGMLQVQYGSYVRFDIKVIGRTFDFVLLDEEGNVNNNIHLPNLPEGTIAKIREQYKDEIRLALDKDLKFQQFEIMRLEARLEGMKKEVKRRLAAPGKVKI